MMYEAVGSVGTLIVTGAAVALFSGGIAFWLIKISNAGSDVRVSTISAISASAILALAPIVVVWTELGFSSEFWLVLVVMVVGALFMAAVTGFPAALYVARRFKSSSAGEESE